MKLYQLIQIKNTFAPHYEEKISASLSYKIFKLCNSIEQEEKFFNQKRQSIIEEFGKRDDNGQFITNDQGFIKMIDGKEADAQKALDELVAVDVDINVPTFTLDELSEIKLSVKDMVILTDIITE